MRLSELLIENKKKRLLDLVDKGVLTEKEAGDYLDDYAHKCYKGLD